MPLAAQPGQDELLDEGIEVNDLPSLKEMFEAAKDLGSLDNFGSAKGEMNVNGEKCEYTLLKGVNYKDDQYGGILTMKGDYQGDSNAGFEFRVVFDESGKFIEGQIRKQYEKPDGGYATDMEDLDVSRAQKVLAQFKPLASQMKQEKKEVLDSLPKIPNKLSWLESGFRDLIELKDEQDLKREQYVLLDPEKQKALHKNLPSTMPLPRQLSNLNIHTGKCTVVVERSSTWRSSYAPNGVVIMYFPNLSSNEDKYKKDDRKFNTYRDAVVFPYSITPNNRSAIDQAWNAAYDMIRRGADSKQVFDQLKRRAETIENEFWRNKRR